ncbi:MAG: glycosyltransferase [Acidobacteriota bacterium]|nr:MAG: glycosyltransferase [Acidobacteriota bacterium]
MDIRLSIIVTVVSGAESLRCCLEALKGQIDKRIEVIVPYDRGSIAVDTLTGRFPWVRFIFDEEMSSIGKLRQHDLYDRRRARGLAAARGAIIAMTEDHAVPAEDWVRQILVAHEQPGAVIGGAVDNLVDRPLNRALYYCDFGRYGTPLEAGSVEYASDVNISYKREAIEAVRETWRTAYHETSVHRALRARGEEICLEPRMIVRQQRPAIGFSRAFIERVEWGTVFAETRVSGMNAFRRLVYAAGAPLLPLLLTARACGHMRRQRRTPLEMLRIAPLIFVLTIGWAWGEMKGYILDPAPDKVGKRYSKAVTDEP